MLADQGISAHKAVPEIPGVEYCGFDPNIMNQWCRLQQEYNDQNNVQSIQLEFRLPDFRDTDERAKLLGARIANAIRVMVRPTDEAIVPIAFEHLKLIFLRHFHNAMVEAGQYIINTFYDGNPMAALAKNKTREQPPNLKALVKKISDASSVTDDRAPSLSWFYNAVNLAAHEAISRQEGLQTFAMLGHSHKLLLLHVPKLKQIEGDKFAEAIKPAFQVKERLAEVAVEKDLSVREFAAEIKKKFPDENTRIDLTLLPPKEILLQLSPADLRRLFNLAMNKIDESQKAVLTYGNALYEFGIVLAEKNEKDVLGKGHFQDWTKNNVNSMAL